MNLKEVRNQKTINTVLGIDVSTQSFAYCLYGQDGPIKWGEIKFSGGDVFARLSDGQKKVHEFAKEIEADLVVVEGAVYVQNKKTVILLSYALGATVSALYTDGIEVVEYSPIKWQNAIGNKALTKAEKESIQKDTPGKTKSWYSGEYRRIRKQRTTDFVKETFGIEVENDNLSDAIGIAHVAAEEYLDKSAQI